MDFLLNLFGQRVPSLDPQEAQKRLSASPRPFLLDVRQPDEFKQAHIQGAKLIPLADLPGRLHELPKGHEILCVCASGSRSQSAARRLVKAGYQAANIQGGMTRWIGAGLPVQRPKEPKSKK